MTLRQIQDSAASSCTFMPDRSWNSCSDVHTVHLESFGNLWFVFQQTFVLRSVYKMTFCSTAIQTVCIYYLSLRRQNQPKHDILGAKKCFSEEKNTHQTEQKLWMNQHISRDTLLKTEISPTFYSPLCRWRTWWHLFLKSLNPFLTEGKNFHATWLQKHNMLPYCSCLCLQAPVSCCVRYM